MRTLVLLTITLLGCSSQTPSSESRQASLGHSDLMGVAISADGQPGASAIRDLGASWVRVELVDSSTGPQLSPEVEARLWATLSDFHSAGIRVLLLVDYGTHAGSPASTTAAWAAIGRAGVRAGRLGWTGSSPPSVTTWTRGRSGTSPTMRCSPAARRATTPDCPRPSTARCSGMPTRRSARLVDTSGDRRAQQWPGVLRGPGSRCGWRAVRRRGQHPPVRRGPGREFLPRQRGGAQLRLGDPAGHRRPLLRSGGHAGVAHGARHRYDRHRPSGALPRRRLPRAGGRRGARRDRVLLLLHGCDGVAVRPHPCGRDAKSKPYAAYQALAGAMSGAGAGGETSTHTAQLHGTVESSGGRVEGLYVSAWGQSGGDLHVTHTDALGIYAFTDSSTPARATTWSSMHASPMASRRSTGCTTSSCATTSSSSPDPMAGTAKTSRWPGSAQRAWRSASICASGKP